MEDTYTKEQEGYLEQAVEDFDAFIAEEEFAGAQNVIKRLNANEYFTAANKLSIELANKKLHA